MSGLAHVGTKITKSLMKNPNDRKNTEIERCLTEERTQKEESEGTKTDDEKTDT